MSGCMASLIHLPWNPSNPASWQSECGLRWAHVDQSKLARERDKNRVWKTVADNIRSSLTPHEANSGLEHGRPELKVARYCHKTILVPGLANQASALEAIVVRNVWNVVRATFGIPLASAEHQVMFSTLSTGSYTFVFCSYVGQSSLSQILFDSISSAVTYSWEHEAFSLTTWFA